MYDDDELCNSIILILLILFLSYSFSFHLILSLFISFSLLSSFFYLYFSGYSAWQTVSVHTIDEEEQALLREEEAIRLRDLVRNQALGITKVRTYNIILSHALLFRNIDELQ